MSVTSLVFLTLFKGVWKLVENNIINFAFTGYWPERERNRWVLPYRPSLTVLGRDYARMPPVWLTLQAIRERDLTLVAVTMISLSWEIAIMTCGFLTSMSVTSGLTLGAWEGTFWVAIASALSIVVPSVVATPSIKQRSRRRIGPPGGIASLLVIVSNSKWLLMAVKPLRLTRNGNEWIQLLQEINAHYMLRKVRARHLSGGCTYGIERVD